MEMKIVAVYAKCGRLHMFYDSFYKNPVIYKRIGIIILI